MNCTFCGDALVPEREVGIEIDRCGRCHSVWFDPGEIQDWAARCGKKLRRAPEIAPDGDGLHLRCPRCEQETLAQVQVIGIAAWHCSGCQGLALADSELGRLAQAARSDADRPYTWKDAAIDTPEVSEAGVSVIEIIGEIRLGIVSHP